MLPGEMQNGVQIRMLDSLEDFHRCVEIQKLVWGESDLETEPYVTFVVARQTGGQVIGAFDDGMMVGFSVALVGLRGNIPYLHSHMTGVLASHRDRRVGRGLKLFQREEALSRGIRLIEWTFDPLEIRNAHFNFNRLGAIARTYIENFYGVTTSPLHRGIATDRLLAEWHLDSPRAISAIGELEAEPVEAPAKIHLPKLEGAPSDAMAAAQARMRSEFQHWFGKNYAATAVHFTEDGADYLLQPWSDF